ncbi:metal-dependent hydrolase [Anaerolineales bacterium HSG6]|nr:metal-dependent hydrolase [Anaerolineales bacterium HSG6]MDM8531789.1 metal-dependent hydrolase [Anaerolineales bacterium HSG25]
MSIKYTYFGHATYLLEVDGKKILIDPFFTSNPSTEVSADSVEADFIVVSHGHGDHVEDLIPIAKRTGAQVISNFEIVNWVQAQGIENAHPQHIGGGFNHEFGHLKLTIAHHGSGLPDGSYGGAPAGLLFTVAGKKLYFACDTALFLDMKLYGPVDLFVVPIGDNFTMGPDDALEAVKLVNPKAVVPCHYNTWPPIEQDAGAWAKRIEAETEATVHVMSAGDTLDI